MHIANWERWPINNFEGLTGLSKSRAWGRRIEFRVSLGNLVKSCLKIKWSSRDPGIPSKTVLKENKDQAKKQECVQMARMLHGLDQCWVWVSSSEDMLRVQWRTHVRSLNGWEQCWRASAISRGISQTEVRQPSLKAESFFNYAFLPIWVWDICSLYFPFPSFPCLIPMDQN